MTLEERMNNITRVVIIVFVIMLLAKMKHAQTFLIIALLVIIIFYYARRRRIDGAAASGLACQQAEKKHSSRRSQKDSDDDDEDDRNRYSTRFNVRAGNGRQEALQQAQLYPERFLATAGSESPEQDEPVDQEDQEEEPEVTSRHQVRKDGKRNPRRPYPLTVPADLVVRAGNTDRPQAAKKPMGRVFNPDPNLAQHVPTFGNRNAPVYPKTPVDPKGNGVQYKQEGLGEVNPHQPRSNATVNRRPQNRLPPHQEAELQEPKKRSPYQRKNDGDLDEERGMYLKRSFQGGPRINSRRQGYQVQDFQDVDPNLLPVEKPIRQPDDEDSDIEAEDVEEVEEAPVVVKASSRPKKTFLPSNYEAVMPVQEAPTPHKMNAYGAGRRIRKVAKWTDNNSSDNRISAADIMYNQAAKLEKTVKARHRIDRESHMNSILSV